MSSNSKRQKPETSPKGRKAGQANRTVMACDFCRKQKTRCFRNPESVSCLRCIYLKKTCSFEQGLNPSISHGPNGGPINSGSVTSFHQTGTSTNEKLDTMQKSINELLKIVKSSKSNINAHDIASDNLVHTNNSRLSNSVDNENENDVDNESSKLSMSTSSSPYYVKSRQLIAEDTSFQTPTNSFVTSPFSIVNNQISHFNIPSPILDLIGTVTTSTIPRMDITKSNPFDVISAGILSEAEAINLMNDFRRNFGRWISFPLNMSSSTLIERIRYKSSLLLTVCYCLASRFSLNGLVDSNLLKQKRNIHRLLLKHLVKDMSNSLLKYSCFSGGAGNGYIEFLQALVLLSIYSLSLSSMSKNAFQGISGDSLDNEEYEEDLKLDPWLLSGMGLNIFVTRSSLGTLLKNSSSMNSPFTVFYDELDSEEFQMLAVLRTYNHLTLVHLINCIFSGRMCVVDPIRLQYCTATLNLPSSTNFDGRMVSEIGILLICYNYLQHILNDPLNSKSVSDSNEQFAIVKQEVKAWYEQWNYIFNQPAPQFVELCYHFCCLSIYIGHIFQKAILLGKGDKFMHKPKNFDVYNENNIAFIIKNSDKTSFKHLKTHALQTVRFINVIESDSYFAYLSDQIHFCFFYAGIVLLKILIFEQRLLKNFSKMDTREIQEDLKLLISKFAMLSTSINCVDDLTTRYYRGLCECYREVFET